MEILKKFENNPNFNNLVKAANNEWVDHVPLYEHIIGGKAIFETTGYKPYELMDSSNKIDQLEGFRQYWDFWKQMGYDTASYEFSSGGALVGSGALGGHVDGCIKDRSDFERYPWDSIPDRFFNKYAPFMDALAATCPAGMKAVGGVGNGVFECVQDIIGYMDLCFIKADDEELYADIFKAMGKVHLNIWDRFMREYSDVFCVLRFGDDLGFNTQTLLAVDDIKTHIIPIYKKIIELVHAKNKPFLLHSCGCIFDVMDDLISNAKINAKHSNEDQIAHFSVWVEKYGDKIGNFGGIDTDVLCRCSPDHIKKYINNCLDKVKGHGGIAFSSGNSIPDYVPTEGYVAMIEAVRTWRGE